MNDLFIGPDQDIDPDINLINLMSANASNYFLEDDFNIMVSRGQLQSKLKILHLNIRSYFKNQSSFWNFLSNFDSKFHIIAFTETWTNPENEDQLTYPGYNTFTKSRTHGRGGGVALLVDDSLEAKIIDLNLNDEGLIESIFVQVSTASDPPIVIGSLYRPPNTDLTNLNKELENMLVPLNTINKCCYLCGDFNMNLLNIDTHHHTNEFLNTMSTYFFRPLIQVPTRITNTSSSLIDNIFTNSPSYKECPGLLMADISDHLPIFVILDSYSHQKNKTKFVSYRPNNEKALANLQAALDEESWTETLTLSNPDLILDSINTKLNTLYNHNFPLTTRKARIYKTKLKPWLSPSLLKSCKTKNKLYKIYLKTKTTRALEKYKRYKNKLTNILRKCEKQYYTNLLELHKTNLKMTWKIIKEILHHQGPNLTNVPLIINGIMIEDPATIANEFNDYYASVRPKMAANVPPSSQHYSSYLKPYFEFYVYLPCY
jgi:exonuclease III